MDKLVDSVLAVNRAALSVEPFLVLGIFAFLFRHFLTSRHPCPSCKLNRNLDDYYRIVYATDFSIPINLNPFINNNMFPTSATRIEIERSLKRLETNVTCFEKILEHQKNAISQVALILRQYEQAYAKTRSEQHRVEEILGRHRSALSSPIRSLPDDLLVVIFQFASLNAACNNQFPWIATGVCRRWRAIAYFNKILWSQFSMDTLFDDPPLRRPPQISALTYYSNAWASSLDASEVETKCEGAAGPTLTKSILNKALKYSGGSPLTFSFNSLKAKRDKHSVAVEWFDIFIDLAPRWKHVELAIESPLIEKLPVIMGRLSTLETLELSLRDDADLPPIATEIFRAAPHLHKVSCRSSFTEFIFPWKQLKELSIHSLALSWDYYLQILCSGSNLEMLDLQAGMWGSGTRSNRDPLGRGPRASTEPVTTLPHLRVFKIDSGLNTLLDYVAIPRLTSITIQGDGNSAVPRLSSLLERSACALRSLSVTWATWDADFTQLLRVCSSLTSLSIDSRSDKTFFGVMAESSSILPSLECFSIGYATITYDSVISIIEMLEARRSRLKKFSISIQFEARGSEDATTLEDGLTTWLSPSERLRLEVLGDAGMKIYIARVYRGEDRWNGAEIPYVSLGVDAQS